MPILKVDSNRVVQQCIACGAQRTHTPNQLTFPDSQGAPGVIALQPCVCGAVEYLVRTAEGAPPHPSAGSFGHLHRLIVDALHDALKASGANKKEAFELRVRRALGDEDAKAWFPSGLVLPDIDADAAVKGSVS